MSWFHTNGLGDPNGTELAGQVLDADEGYQERLKAATELLLPGTFDKVYSSVE